MVVLRVRKGHKVHKDHKGFPVLMVLQDHKALQDLPVQQALRGHKDHKDHKGRKDLLVLPVHKVRKVRKDHKVLQEVLISTVQPIM
jgi:hypothetical protein